MGSYSRFVVRTPTAPVRFCWREDCSQACSTGEGRDRMTAVPSHPPSPSSCRITEGARFDAEALTDLLRKRYGK